MNKISERNKTNVLSIKDLFEVYKKDDKIIAFIKVFPYADTCWVLRIKNNSTNINIVKSLSTYEKVDYIIKEVNGCENIKKCYLSRIDYLAEYMFDIHTDLIVFNKFFHCDVTRVLPYLDILKFVLCSCSIYLFLEKMLGKDWDKYIDVYKCL